MFNHSPYPGDGFMLAVSAVAALLALRAFIVSRGRRISLESKSGNTRDFWIFFGIMIVTLGSVFYNHAFFGL